MKIITIVQARLNSKRLPNKVFKKFNDRPVIEILANKLLKSKKIGTVVFAIPSNSSQKKLLNYLKNNNLNYFEGSEKNVLDRFYKTAKKYSANKIIRITADCPLLDVKLLEKILSFSKKNHQYDYVSNTLNPTYPDGLDVEIFSMKALTQAWKKSKTKEEKEHVTKYFKERDEIEKFSYENKKDYSYLRWTLDTKEDFKVLNKIFKKFKRNKNFKWESVLKFCLNNEHLMTNRDTLRNYKSSSLKEKYWEKAKKFIPGQNSMISKHPNLYSPNLWPTYFKKAKGCAIWSLDNKKFLDLSIMSAGTNILGYANDAINKSVISSLKNGNISTLNSFEEVVLAEKLISINPWAEKVLFSRTGGEANAIAVRLARAYTGKDKIAICGYHGWHDWYLAASKSNEKKIKKEQLPFYTSMGVPKSLLNSIIPFEYNNLNSLKNIILNNKDIGVIKMEVERNEKPKANYLNEVKKIASKNNIVLIFDECTTGFRETFGGIYKKYKVTPDIAIFGKALGNGYPITAVVGKKDIMNMKEKTFISSTFWTERAGPVAALKTLEIMEKIQSWKKITENGKKIMKFWKKIARKNRIILKVQGIPSLCNFQFKSQNHQIYKNFITQEMLKKGFLANNIVYSSISHSDKILKKYFEFFEEVFENIKDLNENEVLNLKLKGNSTLSFRK